jgi:hypothetical protein
VLWSLMVFDRAAPRPQRKTNLPRRPAALPDRKAA